MIVRVFPDTEIEVKPRVRGKLSRMEGSGESGESTEISLSV